jgi:hypothetical protein
VGSLEGPQIAAQAQEEATNRTEADDESWGSTIFSTITLSISIYGVVFFGMETAAENRLVAERGKQRANTRGASERWLDSRFRIVSNKHIRVEYSCSSKRVIDLINAGRKVGSRISGRIY